MLSELGTSWADVGLIVLSTAVMYLAFVIAVRLVGQRSLATVATVDIALVIAIGSLIGRTALLHDPTLAKGLIAIGTLFAMQGLLGLLRSRTRVQNLFSSPPLVLVEDGMILAGNMRRAHLLDWELFQKVRLAGAGGLADIQLAVLERNGQISIIRAGTAVSPEMFTDLGRPRIG